MRIVEQSWSLAPWNHSGETAVRAVADCARTCYQSAGKDDEKPFLRGRIKAGHESVLEHISVTVNLLTNRGVLAEITRHRVGVAFSVESTRYVAYRHGAAFIRPVWLDEKDRDTAIEWRIACMESENRYTNLLQMGWKPEQARDVLNMALATRVTLTANLRAWRHIFHMRADEKHAHPQMSALMRSILEDFRVRYSPFFDDIYAEDQPEK